MCYIIHLIVRVCWSLLLVIHQDAYGGSNKLPIELTFLLAGNYLRLLCEQPICFSYVFFYYYRNLISALHLINFLLINLKFLFYKLQKYFGRKSNFG